MLHQFDKVKMQDVGKTFGFSVTIDLVKYPTFFGSFPQNFLTNL